MAVSRTASAGAAKPRKRPIRTDPFRPPAQPAEAVKIGDLSGFLGYSLKRATADFRGLHRLRRAAAAHPRTVFRADAGRGQPSRNQTEIASTLGILRPNFVALLDELESRDLCVRSRSSNDRRSHILRWTEKGRAVLARARKLIETRHEARLRQLLGNENCDHLLVMLTRIAQEF